jgi:mannose-1-phosphate guanylyltransferase/mannose-6-phosphate isomerase
MHHQCAEHRIVVKGTAEATNGDRVMILSENEYTFIPLGHVHRMADLGKLPLEIIEMQVGTYFVEDDIIRLENTYRRTARNELAQEPSLCDDSSPAKTLHSRA